jgi:hypothetical protein
MVTKSSKRIAVVDPLARQAHSPQHPHGLADHGGRASDVGLALPVRQVAGGHPAHVALHSVKGRIVRGHLGELETRVGVGQVPQVRQVGQLRPGAGAAEQVDLPA